MPTESTLPPFPASGGYLDAIRSSSRKLRIAANVKIEPEALKRLLLSPAFTTSYARVSAVHGLAFPLNFASPLSELNFLSILSLLNFASGYRVPLHEANGRGAWDSVRAFCFSLYITSTIGGEGDFLSARGMKSIGVQRVAELIGVNLHVEKPHDTLQGVTVGELGGPCYELCKLISRTLKETGQTLERLKYQNLGSFVAEALKEGQKAPPEKALDVVLERVVKAIPGFQDMALVNNEPIYCFKKALFLIHAVGIRFGLTTLPAFFIPDTSRTPVFTDNVVPSLLIHLGVIDLSSAAHNLSSTFPRAGLQESLTSLLEVHASSGQKDDHTKRRPTPDDGSTLTTDQAYILRAAAIDACELLVETARTLDVGPDLQWMKEITTPMLDMWIWSVAKDRTDYRQLPRFVLRDTIFF